MSLISWRAMPRVLSAASFAAALAWSSTAAAAPSCAAGELSVPFSYTGSDQTYVVPSGYTKATVYLLGAQGASGITIGANTGGSGGLGAQVSGQMTLIPGETLTVGVGGQGSVAVNGGGIGGINVNGGSTRAGTGGGGTDIRKSSQVAIAGGGGGGGNAGGTDGGNPGANGGNGGTSGAGGQDGANSNPSVGPFGGRGGSVGVGGAAGSGCPSFSSTAGSNSGTGGNAWFFNGSPGSGTGGGGGGGATVGGGGGGAGVGTTGCANNNNGGGGGGAGGTSSAGTLTVSSIQEGVNSGNGSALLCLSVGEFTISGTGSSTVGNVTLSLTSSSPTQTLVVPANAANFSFPTALPDGTAWNVAVTAKPANQSCSVTPASGTLAGANVTNLVLSCQTITAQNQSLTLLAGTTGTVSLQTGAVGGPFTSAAIVTPPAAAAGTASIIQVGGVYTLQFVAAPTYSGTTSLTYTLTSAVGTSIPASVVITVNPRPDPSLDADVVGLVRGEVETAKRFAATQISSFNERLEQLHNEGAQRQSTARLSVTGQSGSDVACQSSGDQVGDLTKRPDYNCAGNAGAVAGAAYADPRNATAYAAGATGTGASAAPAAASTAAGGTATPTNLAVWLGGYVNFGNNDNGTVNLNNTLVGVSGGVDYRFSPEFTAGIGLGYGHDKTAFGASSSRTLAEALSIAAYGSYRPSPGFYIDGLLGYSQLTYDSERFVTQNSLTARGSRDGDQIFGSISLGYEYRSPRDLLFATYGRLSGSSSTLDGFSETGAGIFNLVYAEQTVDSLSGTLGLRTEKAFALDNGTLTSRVRIEYSHDFEGSSLATLGYDDLGLLIHQIDAPAFSRNYLTLGLGFDAQFREGSTVGLSYNGSVGLNGDSIQHLVQLKFGVPF
jgi:uncharacterized protein YhjY with autotransporter beta-barrel domain